MALRIDDDHESRFQSDGFSAADYDCSIEGELGGLSLVGLWDVDRTGLRVVARIRGRQKSCAPPDERGVRRQAPGACLTAILINGG